MNTQLASGVTIYKQEAAETAALGVRGHSVASDTLVATPPRRFRVIQGGQNALSSLVRRESLHRRMLATADVLATTVALVLVLSWLGDDQPGLAALIAMPLVIVVFKIAGLYDRDQLRLRALDARRSPAARAAHGPLRAERDDPPAGPGRRRPRRRPDRRALARPPSWRSSAGAMLARWVAGRSSPIERCLVIGELQRADRIREKLATSRARATVVATLPLGGDDESIASASPRASAASSTSSRCTASSSPRPRPTPSGVVELIRIAKATACGSASCRGCSRSSAPRVEFEDVDGMTMLGVRPFGLSRSSRALKRAFDLVATSIGLLAIAPLIAAHRAGDPAGLQGPGLLSPGARRARRAALPDPEVPLDGRRTPTRRRISCARSTRSATACSRSATTRA